MNNLKRRVVLNTNYLSGLSNQDEWLTLNSLGFDINFICRCSLTAVKRSTSFSQLNDMGYLTETLNIHHQLHNRIHAKVEEIEVTQSLPVAKYRLVSDIITVIVSYTKMLLLDITSKISCEPHHIHAIEPIPNGVVIYV